MPRFRPWELANIKLPRCGNPLEQASLLPASIYTDPAIFELERERIFARSWLPGLPCKLT